MQRLNEHYTVEADGHRLEIEVNNALILVERCDNKLAITVYSLNADCDYEVRTLDVTWEEIADAGNPVE